MLTDEDKQVRNDFGFTEREWEVFKLALDLTCDEFWKGFLLCFSMMSITLVIATFLLAH